MNKELLQALSIAGMVHDIGKFAERAYAIETGDPDMIQQEYRYAHALHTEQALKLLFPEEQLARTIGDDAECTVLNLAARHHKPRSTLELIVAEADRIASGHERASADVASDYDTGGRERKSKTPMTSIMARICLKKDANTTIASEDWRYRINHEGLAWSEAENHRVFPVTPDTYGAEDVRRDYCDHWRTFLHAVVPEQGLGLDLFAHTDTFFDVCRTYQWCLPASTRKEEMPDVSLYDHQKVTAALAACLYWYHEENGSLDNSAVTDRRPQKFLLYCGDISGIQQFIYQLSSKGAYRTLKGRSFYVQLLSEMLAGTLVRTLGLTRANILYASGGKFYLLLPNTASVLEALTAFQEKVNLELLREFSGDLYVRFSRTPLSGDDLTRQSGRTLCQIWDELTRKLVIEDRKRYAGIISQNYDQLFAISDGNLATCKVCHCSMSRDSDICQACSTMEEIGRRLGTASHVVLSETKQTALGRPVIQVCDRYVYLLDQEPETIGGEHVHVLALNASGFSNLAIGFAEHGILLDCTPFLVGSTHKFDSTFDEIAQRSRGVKRLGILRMDVDSLGKIFGEGLQNYRHETISDTRRFHSLGRITTLSWQLNLFFSGILPQVIHQADEWRDRVSVVYSGGDDLFLIGAWDALPGVALEIRRQFARFTCDNPSFSLSGGLVLTGGKFPIYKSAEIAGEAEDSAKQHETAFPGGKTVKKASFTFLGTPMHWSELEEVARLNTQLVALLTDPRNGALLRRLQEIAASWESSRASLERREALTIEAIQQQLAAEKWRWRMVYALSRFTKDKPELKKEIDSLQRFITSQVGGTSRTGIELLGLLARWCELSMRNEKIKEAV